MCLKRLSSLLLLASFCSAQALPADIYFTEAEVRAIRQELRQMSADTIQLRGELKAQQGRSEALLEMSERLQERLESALMRLEESERLLEISETELSSLLAELIGLRTAYSALWESWTVQKNEARRWKRMAVTGWISTGLIFAGGIVWMAR